jgi:hypothetical protein
MAHRRSSEMKSILRWEINTNDRKAKGVNKILSNVLVISESRYEPTSCYIWEQGGEFEDGRGIQNVLRHDSSVREEDKYARSFNVNVCLRWW